jgi:bacillolysin
LTEAPGQPDTYGGDYFFDFNSGQDAGGVHVNSGIMNHWFYMLSMGEGGTNDLGNNYDVSPIGIDDAATITYYNFTNNMTKHSQYEDAMEGSVEAALLLFGECSFEHIQTQNAWYAAGLGTGSACFGASVEESTLNFSIYPNPAQDVIAVKFTEQGENIIEVYNVNGQLMAQFNNVTSGTFVIDISNYAAGTYLIKVLGASNSTTKFIKQ